MPHPVLLAIETSQRKGGVALSDAKGVVHVEMLRESQRHDDDLMPAIDRLLTKAGLQPGDLEAVGLSIGPGGFTGLRIAITTAKMLAETLEVKLIAVPSALVATESHNPALTGPILVALASKGETSWLTKVDSTSGRWEIRGEPGLLDAHQLDLTDITVLLGDHHVPEAIRKKCEGTPVPIVEPQFDPVACLKVSLYQFASGDMTDPLMLHPLYPRPPEAVTLWEKRRKRCPDGQ
ncbi:MAG: tRNA (adenosine(37)-N6)-threonylcarbamoyltransferase complex dimerization subunit type 1 TsaB [Planctomycetes bacterium]|nr:tRNA (adenosine(37)-N6)-threonylcarbamoyltransferase complex dimerization subunit type 1 TsaB [Planctomycetota bacterium]